MKLMHSEQVNTSPLSHETLTRDINQTYLKGETLESIFKKKEIRMKANAISNLRKEIKSFTNVDLVISPWLMLNYF